MDRDTIIRLAREAAFHTPVQEAELLRFAALVAAHEREECARICESRPSGMVKSTQWWGGYKEAMRHIAAAIRSRT